MADQYLVDHEEIMDMLSELGGTPFPAVGAPAPACAPRC